MRLRPADKAWLSLAFGVLAWDLLCPDDEMLSEASSRYAASHPLVAYAVVVSVALHLVDRLPSWIDPIHGLGIGVRRLRGET